MKLGLPTGMASRPAGLHLVSPKDNPAHLPAPTSSSSPHMHETLSTLNELLLSCSYAEGLVQKTMEQISSTIGDEPKPTDLPLIVMGKTALEEEHELRKRIIDECETIKRKMTVYITGCNIKRTVCII